jgi:4-hydroxyphenylacetate 3-monooxygenase
MPARTGAQFLERLAARRTHVEIQGDTLRGGVAEHPAFANVVRTYAGLFDQQHDPAYSGILTYPSPLTGDQVATSFLVPRTPDDLVRRRLAYRAWADRSLGLLGRTGDYLNSALMALASASDWLGQRDAAFGRNITAYYEKVREEDLLCTHTLIPPQANRAVSGSQQAGGTLMAHVVREDDNGIVVRGARMLATIGPFADELLVFPSTVLRGTPEDKPYSFAFAVPTDAPGLRFIAREPFDYGRSGYDHPLGSRFDEPDAVVVFDDVHVPYERCFALGDPELCNGFYAETGAVVHMTHQVIARTTAKTEYILGLTTLLTESVGIGKFPHVQADLAEIITTLETLRALGRAAEADATVNPFGVLTPAWPPLNTARNLYPRLYQRFPEILRKLGASGLMAIPTEADVTGAAAADIGTYLQAATLDGAARVKLFRLVWDTCASAFASRQALYEYYFFGDPVRTASAYAASYDTSPYVARVRDFLAESGGQAQTSLLKYQQRARMVTWSGSAMNSRRPGAPSSRLCSGCLPCSTRSCSATRASTISTTWCCPACPRPGTARCG